MSSDMHAIPRSYEAWTHARDAATLGPGGLAELASTTWLGPSPRPVPGVTGRWHVAHGVAVGTLPPGDATDHGSHRIVRVPAGETDTIDDVRVAAFARDGEVALRAHEPGRAARLGMLRIERHPYSARHVITGLACRTEAPAQETLAVDGHRASAVYDVRVSLTIDGTELGLLTQAQGDTLFAAFSDAAHERFRMLRIPWTGADGPVQVDLNRAYLPPSTFSPHYVCVTPPAPNRWDVPVPAGERSLVTSR